MTVIMVLLFALPMLAFVVASVLAGFILVQEQAALLYPGATKVLAGITITICPLLFFFWASALYILLTAPG